MKISLDTSFFIEVARRAFIVSRTLEGIPHMLDRYRHAMQQVASSSMSQSSAALKHV